MCAPDREVLQLSTPSLQTLADAGCLEKYSANSSHRFLFASTLERSSIKGQLEYEARLPPHSHGCNTSKWWHYVWRSLRLSFLMSHPGDDGISRWAPCT